MSELDDMGGHEAYERLLDDPATSDWLRQELSMAAEAMPSDHDKAVARAALAHLMVPGVTSTDGSGSGLGDAGPQASGTPGFETVIGNTGAATPWGMYAGATLIATLALGGGLWLSQSVSIDPGVIAESTLVADAEVVDAAPEGPGPEATIPPQDTTPAAQLDNPVLEAQVPESDEPDSTRATARRRARARARRRAAQAAEASSEETAPTPSPEEELELLLRARRQLRSRPQAALSALRSHAQRFPRGVFAEEREALRIEALLNSGRHAQAQRLGQAFLRSHPRSAHGARIRQLLANIDDGDQAGTE